MALAPLYLRVAALIRRADPQRLIFFEGNLFSLYTPASRGFVTLPATNNTLYAQHLYCSFQSAHLVFGQLFEGGPMANTEGLIEVRG